MSGESVEAISSSGYHGNYKSMDNKAGDNDLMEIELDGLGNAVNVEATAPTSSVSSASVPVDNTEEDVFTVEQAVDRLGFGRFQVKLSLLTGLAWMADAMEMMILSILSPALHCEWGISSFSQALITTIVFVGMMISSSVWGSFCDRFGRKAELIMCSFVTFYFGLLSAFSPTLVWMFILRGLTGFGIGGAPQSVTLYAEFLPSSSRAKCIVLVEVFWAIGTCFEVLLALIIMPTLGWRWLLVFSAFPLLIFIICCVWLPESARFDVTRGHPEKAMATLQRIAKENGKPMLLGKLKEQPNKHVKRGRVTDLFTKELRVTTVLLWLTWFASAFSYYGIVLMATELLESSGDSGCPTTADVIEPGCRLECKVLSTNDYGFLLWTTLAEFPGLVITLLVIECIGRKKTMSLEFLAFSIFVALVATCATKPVVTTFIFIGRAFITGAFQAAYVYTPEVYPTSTRALGLGMCSGAARVGAIATPFVAQVLLKESIYGTIATYCAVCLIAAVSSLLLPIETRGRAMKDTAH